MIDGLALEYGHARLCARLAVLPDERLWQQLHSARSLPALLDVARASVAAPLVSGVALPGAQDDIELALRQQLRAHIDQATAWAPRAWRRAILWTRWLADLPAIDALQAAAQDPDGTRAAAWLARDAQLAPCAAAANRAALHASPAGELLRAIEKARAPLRRPLHTTSPAVLGNAPLHSALQGWLDGWRARWPRCNREQRDALEHLVRITAAHVRSFGALHPDQAPAARQLLQQRVRALLREAGAQPVAWFAYLLLLALTLERLRGEFAVRAARRVLNAAAHGPIAAAASAPASAPARS